MATRTPACKNRICSGAAFGLSLSSVVTNTRTHVAKQQQSSSVFLVSLARKWKKTSWFFRVKIVRAPAASSPVCRSARIQWFRWPEVVCSGVVIPHQPPGRFVSTATAAACCPRWWNQIGPELHLDISGEGAAGEAREKWTTPRLPNCCGPPSTRTSGSRPRNSLTRWRGSEGIFHCHFFLSGVEPNHVLCRESIFWQNDDPALCVVVGSGCSAETGPDSGALGFWEGPSRWSRGKTRLGLIILLRFLAIFRPFSSAHSLRSLAESVAVVVLVRWATAWQARPRCTCTRVWLFWCGWLRDQHRVASQGGKCNVHKRKKKIKVQEI